MEPDERAIRDLHTTWIDAVNAGDLACLLGLMADDVVFLSAGRAPFGAGGATTELAGHRLTIYRQQPDRRWLLARDAHTLSAVAS